MTTARKQYANRIKLKSDLSFTGDKGVTKQADLKESDINLLFKRFEKTGTLPSMIAKEGKYGDFSEVPDYQEAVEIVITAREQFDNLDAHVRNRFDNDPAKFLEFATNEKNLDEMEKLGLLNDEGKAKVAATRAIQDKQNADKINAQEADKEKALIERVKQAIAAGNS